MSQRLTQRYYHRSRGGEAPRHEPWFRCLQCGLDITCDPLSSGVQNRNHCPCCLWSRHLDALVGGDRLSACRAAMRPIGITTKRSRNKYASERDGEIMLIHQCSICKKLSINRVAADDSIGELVRIFDRSCELSAEDLVGLTSAGIAPLRAQDRDLLLRRLYGSAKAVSLTSRP